MDDMPRLEIVSGAPFWNDENYDEFMMACLRAGCDRYQDPWHVRLLLITGERNSLVDYERCQESWGFLRELCPSWPGFLPERCSTAVRERILKMVDEVNAAL